MRHTVMNLLCITLLFIAIYMLYRYIETSRIAKLMEKKKSLITSEKSKIKNHSFFLVSSFLILFLSVGAAAKTISADKNSINTEAVNGEMNEQLNDVYSMGQDPVVYDADEEIGPDAEAAYDVMMPSETAPESKLVREASSEFELLNSVNSLLSQTDDDRFEAMNAVTLVSYTFDEEAIANYLVEGQELNIYQEGDDYYVEVRQVYRLEEASESSEESE